MDSIRIYSKQSSINSDRNRKFFQSSSNDFFSFFSNFDFVFFSLTLISFSTEQLNQMIDGIFKTSTAAAAVKVSVKFTIQIAVA